MTMKLQKWTCPKCGKEIKSMYEGQFKFNVDTHSRICDGPKKPGRPAKVQKYKSIGAKHENKN